MYAMAMPNFRLATPEEVVELDHENRLIQQQLAKVLDEVRNWLRRSWVGVHGTARAHSLHVSIDMQLS